MSNTQSSSGLEQGLKPRHVTMLSIAGVIGAGLFVGSGHAIAQAGPAVLLAYAAAIGVFSDAPNLIAAQRVVAARRMYRDRSILNRHRHYQGVVVDTWTKPR